MIFAVSSQCQKETRLFFTETKNTIPERESLESERDPNTE
nr:MAG TPA: hypothetical protein [Caudoviricetes sp.]